MKNQKGVSMITLIITIIVIIILAAIAFVAAGDSVSSAQFSKYATAIGEYGENFRNDPLARVTESLGTAGKLATDEQKVYCAARDIDLADFDTKLNGIPVPAGYTSARFQTDIKDSTGKTFVLADAETPVYEIDDKIMAEYVKGEEFNDFYGDSNGKETHWVTADYLTTGRVFTLPGYPRTVDGEDRMYITADLYYLAATGEADLLTHDDLTALTPDKVSGDVVTGNQVASEASHSIT